MSDLPADSATGVRARLPTAPVRTACGLAVVTGYVAVVDPERGGVTPPCPFHALTGWWCPGCGMTRAAHHLLRGDVTGALRYNALLPLVVTLIALMWCDWYGRTIGRRSLLAGRMPAWAPTAGIVVAVAFAVVRNLPGMDQLRG